MTMADPSEICRVAPADLERAVGHILIGAGVDPVEGPVIASAFVWSNRHGQVSQGVVRLATYLARLDAGVIRSPAGATIESRGPSLALVDGGDGFGQYVAAVAMDEACRLARGTGLGLAAVRRSNHFGAGGWIAERAAKGGLLGVAMSNARQRVAPPGATTPVLGTNPLAFAVPTRAAPLVVDFSTAPTSGSRLRREATGGTPMPGGLMVMLDGREVTDPADIDHAAMRPLGGGRGFAMGLFVEVLSAALSGAAFSPGIASIHADLSRPADVGHFLLAIDPGRFASPDAFLDRIERLAGFVRSARPEPGAPPARMPGDRGRDLARESEVLGVPLDGRDQRALATLAARYRVPLPW